MTSPGGERGLERPESAQRSSDAPEGAAPGEGVEARLRVAERLAALGTLAAGVAHAINNPIAAVLANLRFVAAELQTGTFRAEELMEAVEDAIASGVRVHQIVRQLKQFSQDDAGESEPAASPEEVLRSAVNLVRHELRHRAQLVIDLEPTPPVAMSSGRLGQVIVNLLLNASQAIAPGRPEANEVRVSLRCDDASVLFEIADSGRGIRPEHLEQVFDPFFVAQRGTHGAGLGLSICHALVTAAGGSIRVTSAVDQGSTFRVVLPAAAPGAR